MENIGYNIDELIKNRTNNICNKKEIPELSEDLIQTDNIGEVIEKLVILHIRMWMLEDRIGISTNDLEYAELKRKTDICVKIKRPKLVEAINRLIDYSIKNKVSLQEDSVKLYGGIDVK